MNPLSKSALLREIQRDLDNACLMALILAGLDDDVTPNVWGPEIIEYVEQTKDSILEKMREVSASGRT